LPEEEYFMRQPVVGEVVKCIQPDMEEMVESHTVPDQTILLQQELWEDPGMVELGIQTISVEVEVEVDLEDITVGMPMVRDLLESDHMEEQEVEVELVMRIILHIMPMLEVEVEVEVWVDREVEVEVVLEEEVLVTLEEHLELEELRG